MVQERLIEIITILRRSLNRDQVLLSRSLNERFKHKKKLLIYQQWLEKAIVIKDLEGIDKYH